MPSVVDIANMALSRIGNSQRIDALTEASAQAEQCSLFYEPARDMVLRDYPWAFATGFVSLAQVATNPDQQYAYAYSMPTDCLFARRIVNDVFPVGYWPFPDCIERPRIPRIGFQVINGSSGRLIVTSISPASLEYTIKVESPELFDPLFVSALAWKLAAQIAPALAKDAGISQNCEAMYRSEIASAAARMLNEGADDHMPESSFITGRY